MDKEEQKEWEIAFYDSVVQKYRKKMLEEKYYTYTFPLQNKTYTTDLSDDELRESIHVAFNIMRELKNINDNGLTEEKTMEYAKELGWDCKSTPKVTVLMDFWNKMITKELDANVHQLSEIQRVAGAWWMLISRPFIISIIVSIYIAFVDAFDDLDIYLQCTDYLIRGIMSIHGDEELPKEK